MKVKISIDAAHGGQVPGHGNWVSWNVTIYIDYIDWSVRALVIAGTASAVSTSIV